MAMNVLSHLTRAPEAQGQGSFVLVAGLLAAASASASLIFACAAPFAAFGALAAIVLPLRSAIAAVLAGWLVNQAIGFGLLGYPQTGETMAWGVVIAAAAVAATIVSALTFRQAARLGVYAVYPVVLVLSYAAYELALFSAIPVLGGGDGFAPRVVANLAFVNAVWLIGLIAAYEVLHRAMSRVSRNEVRSASR
jgi:hypothetical protein